MAGFETRVTVKRPDGSSESRTIGFSSRKNLFAAIRRRFSDMKFRLDSKYGAEVSEIAGIKKSGKAGVHFTINGQVPWIIDPQTGKKLYLSLYHIIATPEMLANAHIVLELVSFSCDYANSVVDARLELRTGAFELEELPATAAAAPSYRLRVPWQLIADYASASPAIGHFRFYLLQNMRNFGGWKKRPREFPQPDAAAFQPLGAALAFALPLAQEQMASFLPLAPASQANQSPMAPGTTIGAAAPATQGEELRPISGCKAGAAQQSFSKGGCGDAAEKKPRRALPPKLSGKSEKVKAVQLSALSGIKAIIFDLDGVVVDSEKAHLATFNQVLRPLGVSIGPRAWGRNYTGIGSVRIMEDVFQKNGIRGDAQALVEKRAKAYQEHLERQGLPAIEGFMEFHSMVSQQGVRSMVASGGHRPHIATSLRSIGLPSMQFVGLGDVKRPKPNPDIFLLAAKRLGVKPSQCIVIEDSLSGVRAAAAAEMGCIALSTTLPASVLQGKAGAVFQNYRSKKMRKLVLRLIFGKKKAGKEKEGEKRRTKEDAKPAGSRAKKKGKRVRMPAVLEF